MRWRINGADRETAKDREIWIESISQIEAGKTAADMGIIVSSILKDPPVVVNIPNEIRLPKRQIKALRVSEMKIASGVAIGIFLFFFLVFLISMLLVMLGVRTIYSSQSDIVDNDPPSRIFSDE